MMTKQIATVFVCLAVLVSCNKDASPRYPEGYDKIYYAFFDYEYDDADNPTLVSKTLNIDKTQETPTPLRIKFMSSIERDFDVEVRLYVRTDRWFLEKINAARTPGMFSTPDSLAVPNLDYMLLDENLETITPVRTDTLTFYSIVFPKARKDTRELYIQPLNNEDYSCPRYAWLSLALTHPGYETEEEVKTNTINHVEESYQVNTIAKSWLRTLIIK